MSESEQLDIFQKRKEMGLNTMIELIMRDDPSLTEEAAQAKLDKIAAEKQANMDNAMIPPNDPSAMPPDNTPNNMGVKPNGNQSQKDNGNGGGNVVNN